MMKLFSKVSLTLFALLVSTLLAQAPLDNDKLMLQPTDSWPMYNGDYSGRRFSPLTTINTQNVSYLSLAWTYRAEGSGSHSAGRISATPLEINGVLYFAVPNHVWAVDARTGQKIWDYTWQPKSSFVLGNRGVSVYKDTLYFETSDCNLMALSIRDGKEKWHVPIADVRLMYYGSTPPTIIKNHVLVGVSGDDLDTPGYLEAHDPETGKLQWRWYTHPNPGEPEAKSWPDQESMEHNGGMTWIPGTYDPELNLYFVGTGNAQPVINGAGRKGDNLYTGTIVAINPDTGKLAWYFQPNPHDSHDWDAVQTPVLFDGVINGKKRKFLAQASRNGWFFVLDRTNGKAIISKPFAHQNWASGVDEIGRPIPNEAQMAKTNGALVSPDQGGAANWPPPSFSPKTGLFYVNASDAYSIYYIFDTSAKPEGWAGNDRGGYGKEILRALDYRTGKVQWEHEWPAFGVKSGILTTAGNLLFTGDPSGNLVAFNSATGKILWHSGLQSPVTNAPITYTIDGTQYLLVAGGDTLYAFVLQSPYQNLVLPEKSKP